MTETEQRTEPKLSNGQRGLPPRHYVKLAPDGTPTDHALCGYLWDRLHVQHNGEICQECVEEQKRLEGKAK